MNQESIKDEYKPADLNHGMLSEIQRLEKLMKEETTEEIILIAYKQQ